MIHEKDRKVNEKTISKKAILISPSYKIEFHKIDNPDF